MRRFLTFFQSLAQGSGGIGLFVVTFLDSSFLSLPEIADLAIVYLVIQRPSLWWYYALMSTAGSVAGCYVLYVLARAGGEAFMRKRFKEHHIAWGLGVFRRYGLLAIIVPSLLPPPMPFKIFVLLAGIAEVTPGTFVGALVLGRGFRYVGEALLALRYGPPAIEFIRHNLVQVSVWLAVLLVIGAAAYVWWRRRRSAPPA
jgi:membrane protein YqaA with SNARE-associated domain